jgi:vacuolar-type H+-ATPase subunit H
MTTEPGDIIRSITDAESQAAAIVHDAEEARVRAISEAESQAAAELVRAKARIEQTHEAALKAATAEAESIIKKSRTEARALAQAAGDPPKERFEAAVQRVVKALRDQWR